MDRSERKSVKVRISGRVQGVWYRGWTVQEARARGLSGWVCNLSDGTVEALFSGAAASVDEMIRLCHDGPPLAHVKVVEVEPSPDFGLDKFEQTPTI